MRLAKVILATGHESVRRTVDLNRAVGRSENSGGPVVHNLPLQVEIGLSDLPKFEGAVAPFFSPVYRVDQQCCPSRNCPETPRDSPQGCSVFFG